MKLSQEQVGRIERYSAGRMRFEANEWAKKGWPVFPLRPGGKEPLAGSRGSLDATTDPVEIGRMWQPNSQYGIGGSMGTKLLGWDLDVQHGANTDLPFPETYTHDTGRGGGNCHKIYAYEPGSLASTLRQGQNVLGPGIDLKVGPAAYLVLPPTIHPDTGYPYTVRDPDVPIHTITDDEIRALYAAAGEEVPSVEPSRRLRVITGGKGTTPKRGGVTTLTELLANPPAEGGRNGWLTQVAGHYAKQYHDKEDLYRVHVEQANQLMPTPLEEREVAKISNSIWDTETAGHPEREARPESGWLVSVGNQLWCQVVVSVDGRAEKDLAPWGDFDIRAQGVAVDDSDRRMFWVKVLWGGKEISTTLDGELLGDDRALRRWLAGLGASIDAPLNASPKTAPGVRLLRYLNSQEPPVVRIVDTLGWDPEVKGFVTHDGLITADGHRARDECGVVADPELVERDVAPFHYGFERDLATARAVLAEVLTFQEETTAAVFGAWCAACLLRPQIQQRSSLFPFFGVEATSESGKTTGFFELMVQLNGNTRGQIAPTRPVLRDYASANHNGIVWADDLDSLEVYGELLRASTSNGTAAKMDMDRSAIRNTRVVAPILVTGEQLGLGDQKALADRAVVLRAESPKGRRSTRGDWLQWDDVLNLKAQYPKGLSVLSGWLVQEALGYEAETIDALRKAKKDGGRYGDKLAVLRAGARLLDALLGTPGAWDGIGQTAVRLEQWIAGTGGERLDQDNSLTLKVAPWALRMFGFQSDPVVGETQGRFSLISTPAFVRTKHKVESGEPVQDTLDDEDPDAVVWVNAALLADAWSRDRGSRVEARTETELALRQQLDSLKAPSRVFRVSGGKPTRYRALPGPYSAAVLRRAKG